MQGMIAARPTHVSCVVDPPMVVRNLMPGEPYEDALAHCKDMAARRESDPRCKRVEPQDWPRYLCPMQCAVCLCLIEPNETVMFVPITDCESSPQPSTTG